MKKRYWLRGGIIATLLFAIAILVFLAFDQSKSSMWVVIYPLLPFAFGSLFIGGLGSIILGFGLQYVLYFLTGSFLGWLYGKIKNRKNIINS